MTTERLRARHGGLEEVRQHNLGAVLRSVHLRGALSRAELTATLGLSRSTVGALIAELTEAGLVREDPPAERRGTGRPSHVVRAQPRVFVYALSAGADEITAAKVALGGGILERCGTPRKHDALAPMQVAEALTALIGRLHRAGSPDALCVGVAAAVGGSVRRADGSAGLSGEIGAVGEELGRKLSALPAADPVVRVVASADLGALAEHTRGCAADSNDVIYLHGDVGVGGAVIAGGRPVAGRGGIGGSFGHMAVNVAGRACGCGGRGCWETEIGEQALLRAAGREGTGREGLLSVVDAASWGDVAAQDAVRQVGGWLGLGVANLVNIFNADTVIFGGTLQPVYLASAAHVRGQVDRHALPAVREHLRLRTPQLGEDAPLLGAAELAFEALLADPLRTAARAAS